MDSESEKIRQGVYPLSITDYIMALCTKGVCTIRLDNTPEQWKHNDRLWTFDDAYQITVPKHLLRGSNLKSNKIEIQTENTPHRDTLEGFVTLCVDCDTGTENFSDHYDAAIEDILKLCIYIDHRRCIEKIVEYLQKVEDLELVNIIMKTEHKDLLLREK